MNASRVERWEMTMEKIEMEWKELEGKKGRQIKEKRHRERREIGEIRKFKRIVCTDSFHFF